MLSRRTDPAVRSSRRHSLSRPFARPWLATALPLAALLGAGCYGNCKDVRPPATTGRVAFAAEVAPTAPAGPTTSPDAGEETDAQAWKAVSSQLDRAGATRGGVYVVTVPREDLSVGIEGMEVPTAAGIESVFSFYHCSCGKTSVVGQFCVTDYEANDVIDALRAGQIEVASIAPMLLHSRANPLLIRFQGEGKAGPLAKTLREALRWTGKERMAPVNPPGR
jgi:hypothetical protein